MHRIILILLVAGCGDGLPDGAVLPGLGNAGSSITPMPMDAPSWSSVEIFTHRSNKDQALFLELASPTSQFVYVVVDASTGKQEPACMDRRLNLLPPNRGVFDKGVGHWNWDGKTLRSWGGGNNTRIDNCTFLGGLGPSDTMDIEAFNETGAFAEGGLVTYDKRHHTLVRARFAPFGVENFGALPDPVLVTMRRDDAGLWAVVHDSMKDVLVVYEIDAASQSVAARMTVPVGGTYKRIVMLDSGVLVWETDKALWGAAVNAGGMPFQLTLPQMPMDAAPWFDGKGFVTALGGPVSVNLASGRVYSNGVALRNGMHVALEPMGTDAVKVTWTGNTDAHGPDAAAFYSQVIDVTVKNPPPGDPRPELRAEAFENGLCTFLRATPGVGEPATPPKPWEAGKHTFFRNASTLHAGACGGPLNRLTAGLQVDRALVPGRGMLLESIEQTSDRNVDTYKGRTSSWAIDHTGSAKALYRTAQWIGQPSRDGVVWSVSDDNMVWRVDASPWLN